MIVYRLFYLIIFLFISISSVRGQELSFMTYNIRLDVASDGVNGWSERKDVLINEIQFLSPNIFGIQEGLPHQTMYLKRNLENYDFIGHGRNGGEEGEYSAIFYDTENFRVKHSGTFWLSETPEEFSVGWDAAYPRICTYGLFTEVSSGEEFWVFNAHLDHIGKLAKERGLALIREKIKLLNIKGLAVILMGDFNAEPQHSIIKEMEKFMLDTYKISKFQYGSFGTFNAFNTNEISKRRIDYIFISKSSGYKVHKYAVLSNLINKKYASDHFPVYVDLRKK